MISVKLPDGSAKQLSDGASAADLAKEISDGLARVAVAAKVNGNVVDLQRPLPDGAEVAILTKRDKEALEVLRHSAAHLMADAILRVYPKAQLTIGPVVDEGFYYDIYYPDGKISVDDFPKIEAEMAKIVKQGHPFVRCVSGYDDANEHYARYKAIDGGHNKFKQELVGGIKDRGEELTFYKHGDFIDLCRGPHVPDTSWLKHVKLTKVAGSYWRADASKEQLQRVYGIAFFSKQELEDHFKFLEEARKRDHRVLGEQLELFFMDEDAPGFPFFYPKGARIWNLLVDFMRSNLRKRGYVEVKTPIVLSESMWHTSGHYQNYLENMFFTKMKLRDEKDPAKINENVEEDRPMAVKPMNCPGHLMLYRTRLHSHNEFPLRIAEMGLVHRRELSGVRHGLFRVQAFTQDDAHHFCTPDQIKGEIQLLIKFFKEIYGAFGLDDVHIELSTKPAKAIGDAAVWEKAESALKETLEEMGVNYKLNPGDGAFYGPKIDFHIRDSLKRSWQCGTIQLDFSMPARFGLVYVGADGARHTPVMIHRACYGSVERFMGILIEHFAGAFPLWLAPLQVQIIPVSEKFIDYAKQVNEKLLEFGLRSEVNLKDDRVGYKIRESSLQKIPYAIVVGEKEVENGSINVRSRDKGELGEMAINKFLENLEEWRK
ncbi:MAG: threonine--tRNA ligase [Planctomycetes bacterium]|nr:threonine--tRNA ligase [Planctomycetota bacterium]MCW8136041.1 threonine--tRNA ligase [Planctomycetota bacterium]